MDPGRSGGEWRSLGEMVEAFEEALARDGLAAVADFAPSADHPQRLPILCELVRVDLEHRWCRGQPCRLEGYRPVFPEVFDDARLLHEMAYEEYRLRQQAGEQPSPDDYLRRFGLTGLDWPAAVAPSPRVDPAADSRNGESAGRSLDVPLQPRQVDGEQAELIRTLGRTDPHAAERLAEAVSRLPRVGTDFLGFRLCSELGRGAFGRVFLARQGDLAGRPVALKVSADVAGETHALARLQHTNIVPIFSVHKRGPLQAVCMPYLGATTLADTLAELRQRARLPDSGEALLSTLRSRKDRAPARSVDDGPG